MEKGSWRDGERVRRGEEGDDEREKGRTLERG